MKKGKRTWLNKDVTLWAHTAWKVEITCTYDERQFVEAAFSVADCHRKITLDFSMYEKGDKRAGISKLDTLFKELELFKAQLLEAYAEVE